MCEHKYKLIYVYKLVKENKKLNSTSLITIQLRVDIVGDDFHHYEGNNATEVRQKHSEASWFTFYPWRQRVFRLELYKESCVGIETTSGYKVALRTRCEYPGAV